MSPPILSPKTMYPKHLSVVTQDAGHQLLLAQDAFTPAECVAWVAFCEGLGLVSTRPKGGIPRPGNAYRDNYRVQVHDLDIAEALWSSGLGAAIAATLPALEDGRAACGFNDNIRMYRYDPGLRFGKHYDQQDEDSLGRQTFYTVLFYLSECGGGETVFYSEHNGEETARIVPTAGSMLLHRHGVDCWQHEALPVTAGKKYILRSDVVFS